MPAVDRAATPLRKVHPQSACGRNSALRFGPHLLMQGTEQPVHRKAENLYTRSRLLPVLALLRHAVMTIASPLTKQEQLRGPVEGLSLPRSKLASTQMSAGRSRVTVVQSTASDRMIIRPPVCELARPCTFFAAQRTNQSTRTRQSLSSDRRQTMVRAGSDNDASQLAGSCQRSCRQVVNSRSVTSSQAPNKITNMPDTILFTVADTDS